MRPPGQAHLLAVIALLPSAVYGVHAKALCPSVVRLSRRNAATKPASNDTGCLKPHFQKITVPLFSVAPDENRCSDGQNHDGNRLIQNVFRRHFFALQNNQPCKGCNSNQDRVDKDRLPI